MIAVPRSAAGSITTVEPQSGQKRLTSCGPLSPVLVYVFGEPCIDTAANGTAMRTLNAVPVCFWQVLQWQTSDRPHEAHSLIVRLRVS
jgi:hypothetical protein